MRDVCTSSTKVQWAKRQQQTGCPQRTNVLVLMTVWPLLCVIFWTWLTVGKQKTNWCLVAFVLEHWWLQPTAQWEGDSETQTKLLTQYPSLVFVCLHKEALYHMELKPLELCSEAGTVWASVPLLSPWGRGVLFHPACTSAVLNVWRNKELSFLTAWMRQNVSLNWLISGHEPSHLLHNVFCLERKMTCVHNFLPQPFKSMQFQYIIMTTTEIYPTYVLYIITCFMAHLAAVTYIRSKSESLDSLPAACLVLPTLSFCHRLKILSLFVHCERWASPTASGGKHWF